VRHARYTLLASRLKGLLLAPVREWRAINDERPGGVTLFRDVIVVPCAWLSLLVALTRWLAGGVYGLTWGIVNFIACTLGCYLTARLTRHILAADTGKSADAIARTLSIYTFLAYIPFRALSECFPPGYFLGELCAVCSLYSLRVLYVGLGTLLPLEGARQGSACFVIGLLVVSLPWLLTQALERLFGIPLTTLRLAYGS
jgi:hypothetical protein